MSEHGQPDSRITVLSLHHIKDYANSRKYYWSCQCKCGNIFVTSSQQILSGKTKSCGCLQKEKASFYGKKNFGKGVIDLTGQTFGRLKVEKLTSKRTKQNNSIWECYCSCGNPNPVYANSTDLRRGKIQSCGCLTSFAEEEIQKILKENNIPFVYQYTTEKCKDKNMLPFDFAILNEKQEVSYIIEFDGKHHFEDCHGWSNLEYVQKHDLMKNNYCFENNIPLIRIPYTVKEIKIEDLKLSSTKFLTKRSD